MRKTPTLLTNVDRTWTSLCDSWIAPSGDVTRSDSGNVPDPRASTANRIVVLRGGSSMSRTGPSGKVRSALERCTRTRTV